MILKKGKKYLNDWVDEQTTVENREVFLKNHLIPNVDLSLANFDEYITKRKEILKSKLTSLLS